MKKGFRFVLRSAFHMIDRFSMEVNFREDKQEKFSTVFGSFISTLILIVTITHGMNKMEVFRDRGETRH